MKNKNVILNWLEDKNAHSYNGNLSASKGMLWSYDLLIGHKESLAIFIHDHTARCRRSNFVSNTTSSHVILAETFTKTWLAKKEPKHNNLEVKTIPPRIVKIKF